MNHSMLAAADQDIEAIINARHADPFGVLGLHKAGAGFVIRAFAPGADKVSALDLKGNPIAELECRDKRGFFEGRAPRKRKRFPYRLKASNSVGEWEFQDPYRFGPILGPMDDYLLVEGTHEQLYDRLGAHPMVHEGVLGVHFAVWAPRAHRVSVVGDFNQWDGRRHQMRKRVDSGLWEIFAPGLIEGSPYKYEIVGAHGALLPLKADPFGTSSEMRPSTASVVPSITPMRWSDQDWLDARRQSNPWREPMSTYEVHLGSWKRPDGGFPTYDELADSLVPYAVEMGFTHLELMPVSEHPLDASWGYQPVGLFAPTRRFGDPAGFGRFVDRAHAAGLAVIVDWVPAHFPVDAHGLEHFDGEALYEHPDPRRGFHPDWNTAIYDLGRREVANILASNALFWLDRFHIDGLRVDAVASMLYLDYSRKAGEWLPNIHGGRENLEAVAFLRKVNDLVAEKYPGALMIAEESTAWPGVSRPVKDGGLGFGFKWNMGWMHDTLKYVSTDPIYRRWEHSKLTFGLLYSFSENFVLPLSHDEVVHGKASIMGRMPGDEWRRFATTRAYYGFMWGHPGKKLLFMGQEFGQIREWNFEAELDWPLLEKPLHGGLKDWVRDLNRLYRSVPALHARECEPEGFRWIVVDDSAQSVLAWLRMGDVDDVPVAVVCNFTPVPREKYRIGLPSAGKWREILNSDAAIYGGAGGGNMGVVTAKATPSHGLPASAEIYVPPLAAIFLKFEPA